MKRNISSEAKIGLFVLLALGIIGYITIQISNLSLTTGRSYTVYIVLPNAEGISQKTPVQVAGIPVGVVDSIKLVDNRQARLGLKLKKSIEVTEDMEVQVRTRGVLGDVYLELVPGARGSALVGNGQELTHVRRSVDYQNIFQNAAEITDDLKEITKALRAYTTTDQSSVAKILKNMEVLTGNLAAFSSNNAQNMNAVVQNLAILTQDLRRLSRDGGVEIEASLKRISAITERIEQGEGTIGRLINDDGTVEKANRVLDNLGDITDTYFSMKTELGYHLEYLGRAGTAKNYVDITLRPRPDKFFRFGVVHNPNPPASTSFETEVFEVNGVETTVERETTEFKKLRFNAQLGKDFDDFTVRGGLIESTGGLGVDYTRGPMAIAVDAYNFGEGNLHLKALAELNVTQSLYILGGVDDITSQDSGVDYFFGVGLRFTDDDINSLFGGAGLLLSR